MKRLTWKQSNIAEYLADYINKHGRSPTRYEIRDAMKEKWFKAHLTRQAIDNQLRLLMIKGIIRLSDKKRRNIILV